MSRPAYLLIHHAAAAPLLQLIEALHFTGDVSGIFVYLGAAEYIETTLASFLGIM